MLNLTQVVSDASFQSNECWTASLPAPSAKSRYRNRQDAGGFFLTEHLRKGRGRLFHRQIPPCGTIGRSRAGAKKREGSFWAFPLHVSGRGSRASSGRTPRGPRIP